MMEYRQAELRLEQLYTQIRMQVVNAQFALTNDRAQVWLRERRRVTRSRASIPSRKNCGWALPQPQRATAGTQSGNG